MDIRNYLENLEKIIENEYIDLDVLMESIQVKISQYKKLEIKFEEIIKFLYDNGIR